MHNSPEATQEPKSLTALLLEDNALDAELTLSRLERGGYAVLHKRVDDRRSFLDSLATEKYDIILADYDVPGFNGHEALSLSRELYPHIPFIVVSGVLGEEVAIDTLQRGATDYVLKQRLERLVPAVRRALAEAEERANRLRAEELAREKDERFRVLTDLMPQMVWTMDVDGRLNYTNPAWRQRMPKGVSSWCDKAVLHAEDAPNCESAWKQAREERAPFSLECRLLTAPEKGHRWFIVHGVPFGSDWLGTATDVHDERLRADALRTAEKLAVTGRMAATIAHEINNPLESLLNIIFLLRREPGLSEQMSQYLELADRELVRVSSIAKQTLAFYRDSDVLTTISAQDLLNEVIRLFQPRILARNLKLRVHVAPAVSLYACWGEGRQVLINLVSNAIDAAPRSGNIALIAAETCVHGRNFAEVRVEDDGPGIAPENLKRIFEPFFSTKGKDGTGLGLWVSKSIAEKFGGTLHIESNPGPNGRHRTVATLRLPCEAAEPQPAARRA